MKNSRNALIAAVILLFTAGMLLAAGIVNLNTASQKDLEALNGVGPATAKKIIASRPYASVSDLSKAGMSPAQIAKIQPFVTVAGAPVARVTPAPAPAAKPVASVQTKPVVVASSGPVDLNTASEKDLEALRGVGPVTARKIVAARPYASTKELSKAGLSAKQIAAIAPSVKVAAASAPAPARTTPPRSVPPAASASGPLNLNSASEKELEALKGIGPATAKKIIAARPYSSVDELSKAGVSAKVIAEIRSQVTTGVVATAPRPTSTAVVRPVPTPSPAATPAAAQTPAPAATRAPASAPSATATARSPHAATAKLAVGQIVNINTASLETLELLPGIGPVKAQAIIDGRPYATPEDIMKVKGIKTGEYAKIQNSISVR